MSLIYPLALCQRRTLHSLWQSPHSSSFSRPFTSRKALAYPRWVNAKAPPHSAAAADEPESESDSVSSDSSSSPSDSSSSSDDSSSSSKTLPSLPSVPTPYSPLLLLPISRRPLFPGFYKAVVIRNPEVIKAVKECVRVGQGWLGVFLIKKPHGTKDGEIQEDIDTIEHVDQVHKVGVFAQVTSVFSAQSDAPVSNAPGSTGSATATGAGSEALTAVLYPHRRIRLDSIVRGEASEVVEDAPAEGTLDSPQASILKGFKGVTLVRVTNHPTPEEAVETAPKDTSEIHALSTTLISLFKDIAALNPLFRDQITNFSINQVSTNVFDEPDKLADFAGAVSSGSPAPTSTEEGGEAGQLGEGEDLQAILEETDTAKRLSKALLVLKKELINAQLQAKLARDVDGKIAKRQREYYLTEQLKGIKKELGLETDGKERILAKFRERAAQLKMPAEVKTVFEEEMTKLSTLEPSVSEANVTRTYLEWLTTLPWGKRGKEVLDLEKAKTVLDDHHWGMESVKDRVIEFVAVGKLRGGTTGTAATVTTGKDEADASASEKKEEKRKPPHGKILLLTGPPGIGKTSIALSIAKALSRAYYRFSVGGLTDVAEIKGHRRTYVGALPGKVVQALKRCGVDNPLVVVDEIDKIGGGRGYAGGGDPSGALLEMLDPEQNAGFMDHYLDVPIDLSNVLFVCTANSTSTIPPALLDRMEVIELSGYVTAEKKEIAQRYLIPQGLEGSGLLHTVAGGQQLVQITTEAVEDIIMWWCRESGVRGLKKSVEKIMRKVAVEVVKQVPSAEPSAAETPSASSPDSPDGGAPTTATVVPLVIPESVQPVIITPDRLTHYLGPQIYTHDRLYSPKSPAPAGVSTGLGYLGNGSGSLMPIEVLSLPYGKGSITLSGNLGNVIKESAGLALSWVRAHAAALGIPDERMKEMKDTDLHVHMPEGAISKDGPSAGTALVSAFVSLLSKKPISTTIAMTGEISLGGRVLPVGGLKEKILAAHRGGVEKILVPAGNRAQVDEVHDSLKGGLEVIFVSDVSEVVHHVFGINIHETPSSSEKGAGKDD